MIDETSHYAYCVCGWLTVEEHHIYTTIAGTSCPDCGFSTGYMSLSEEVLAARRREQASYEAYLLRAFAIPGRLLGI